MLLCCWPASWITIAVVEPLAEKPAVEVQVLRAGHDIGARVGRRAVDAPASQVHAQFARGALDLHVFHRPERHHREVGDAAVARVQHVELDAVEIDAHAPGIAVVRGDLRREQEPVVMSVTPGTAASRSPSVIAPLEKIWSRSQCQRLAADVGRARRVRARDRRLDRVARRALGLRRSLLRGRIAHRLSARPARVDRRALGGVGRRALRGVGADGIRARRRALRGEDRQRRARGQQQEPPQRARGRRQRTLPRTNSTNVRTGTPVGPRGSEIKSVSEYAVPATSRCAHL